MEKFEQEQHDKTLESFLHERPSLLNNLTHYLGKVLSLNRHIIDSTGLGIIVFNESGEVTFINRFAKTVISTGMEFFSTPERPYPESSTLLCNRTLPGTSPAPQYWTWNLFPLKGPAGWIILIHDQSRQYAREEEERQVENLYLSKELVAGGAHEIMNSLTTLGGFVELLMEVDSAASGKAGYYEIMQNEINRCGAMLQEYLFLARSPEPRIKKVSLEELLAQLILLVENKCEKQSISIKRNFATGLPPVDLDPDQIKQVFLNLVNNAVQAMAGGGVLHIAACARNGKVCIDFSDNGRGIPEEEMDNIFDPFYTTKSDGTGLGLTLSARIVKNHNGTLTVRSNTKNGSVFSVVIPIEYRKEGL